jgi:hypothetical protein
LQYRDAACGEEEEEEEEEEKQAEQEGRAKTGSLIFCRETQSES